MKAAASTESTKNPKRNNFRWVEYMAQHLINSFLGYKRLLTYKVLDVASRYKKLRMKMENIYENEHSNYLLSFKQENFENLYE